MSENRSIDLTQLRRRIGDVSQLVSTRAARLADGNEGWLLGRQIVLGRL